MSLPLALDAAQDFLLAKLESDVRAAWFPTAIFYDPPTVELPARTVLPVAYIVMESAEPDDSLGFEPCHTAARLPVMLALRFPVSAGALTPQKRTKAEALRVLLSADPLYHELPWRWDGDEYIPADPAELDREAKGTWGIVRLRFSFWIDGDWTEPEEA